MATLNVSMPGDDDEAPAPKKPTKKKAPARKKAPAKPKAVEPEPEVEEVADEPILDPADGPVRLDEQASFEDLDPDEEVWPGGPTAGQLTAWKEEYGKLYISAIDFDYGIVWHPMKRSQYKDHVRYIEQVQATTEMTPVEFSLFNEEVLSHSIILFPEYDEDFEDAPAGVPSLISQQAMEASGFVTIDIREI